MNLTRSMALRSQPWLRSDEMRVGNAVQDLPETKINYKDPTETEFIGREYQYQATEKQVDAPKKRKTHLQWSRNYQATQARQNNMNIVTSAVVTNP